MISLFIILFFILTLDTTNNKMFRKFTAIKPHRPIAAIMANMQRRTFFTFVDTSTTGIKTTFGKAGGMFSNESMLKPGFRIFMPFIQSIHKVSNRQQQSTYTMTVKTLDNATCDIDVNVQTQIKGSNTEKAFFTLDDPDEQIRSYIEGMIISNVPHYNLDDLFLKQGDISKNINETLVSKLEEYGYTVVSTQITAIQPVRDVVDSMNKINASQRLKEAATNEAAADYIREVKGAEARAESKRLQGEGISNMRTAILNGYGESVSEMSSKYGLAPATVLDFLMEIQKLETLDAIGTADNQNRVIFTSLGDANSKLRNSIMEARQAK